MKRPRFEESLLLSLMNPSADNLILHPHVSRIYEAAFYWQEFGIPTGLLLDDLTVDERNEISKVYNIKAKYREAQNRVDA